MTIWLQGLLLGLSYVAPIGMQNLYVINTAVQKSYARALTVALITIFFDITLALACFFGIGSLMTAYEWLRLGTLAIGSLMVIWIGWSIIRSEVRLELKESLDQSLAKVVVTCFLVTWANPQALIDGSLLLGGMKASLAAADAPVFMAGVIMASAGWFLTISGVFSLLRKQVKATWIRTINWICGGVIILYGIKLAVAFLQGVHLI